jgi:hypothetical protein
MHQMMARVNVRRFSMVAALFVALAVDLSAGAKKPPTQKKQQPQPQPTTQSVTPQQEQAVTQAQQSLATAKANLKAVVQKETAKFEASADYLSAKNDLAKAQGAYDAAAAPVLAKVDASADYTTAIQSKNDAQAKMQALRDSGGGSPDDMEALAQQSMQASSQAHQLEQSALEEDPAVIEAKANVVAAQAKVAEKRSEFNQNLQTLPDYVSAKSAVDAADKKLAAAQAALASAP